MPDRRGGAAEIIHGLELTIKRWIKLHIVTKCVRRIVKQTESAAGSRLLINLICETHSRRPVVLVGLDDIAADSVLTCQEQLSGIYVEHRDLVLRAIKGTQILIAHTQVKREAAGSFPVVLEEEAILVVAQHGITEPASKKTLEWSSGQHLSEFVPLRESRARGPDGIKIESARGKEGIVVVLPSWPELKTCLHRVQAKVVGQCVNQLTAGFPKM